MTISINKPLDDNSAHTFMRGVQTGCSTVARAVAAGVQAVAAVVFIVAHPIIGPLGSLACLCQAAYHGLALNYHWRRTCEKDQQGNFLTGTALVNLPSTSKNPYTNINPGFTQEDLPRLQHEQKRLYHLNAATESLKWARGLAKCAIPIIGPFWALASEINTGGSIALQCEGCTNHWKHETPEERLQRHIDDLKP